MRISCWSSDVCSSDLAAVGEVAPPARFERTTFPLGGDKSFNKNHLLNNDLSLRTVEPGASLGQLLLGDPGTIRTCYLRLRRASLYPVEILGQSCHTGYNTGRRLPTHTPARNEKATVRK